MSPLVIIETILLFFFDVIVNIFVGDLLQIWGFQFLGTPIEVM